MLEVVLLVATLVALWRGSVYYFEVIPDKRAASEHRAVYEPLVDEMTAMFARIQPEVYKDNIRHLVPIDDGIHADDKRCVVNTVAEYCEYRWPLSDWHIEIATEWYNIVRNPDTFLHPRVRQRVREYGEGEAHRVLRTQVELAHANLQKYPGYLEKYEESIVRQLRTVLRYFPSEPAPDGLLFSIPISSYAREYGTHLAVLLQVARPFQRDNDITPILNELCAIPVDYSIPRRLRFEHHHILARSGSGKTSLLQHMIMHDLKAVERGEASIVVLDSQREMIDKIKRLKVFAPGQPLYGKLIVIDPTDIEHPVHLPLFQQKWHPDQGERERMENFGIYNLQQVFAAMLDTTLSTYQRTLLDHCIRLCRVIPNATINTLREVLENRYPTSALDKLSDDDRSFFENQFNNRHSQYIKSRQEVLDKFISVTNSQAIQRMFSSPHATVDIFEEMNAGKVILIDAAKSHMPQAFKFFGGFFVSQVNQAVTRRAKRKKLPTYFYIDEAHEYVSPEIGEMLKEARKQNVGLILSHQELADLGDIHSQVMTNTAIKFTGDVSHSDAVAMAKEMRTTPEQLRDKPKYTFIAYQGDRAVPIEAKPDVLEDAPKMTDDEWEAVRDAIRARYSVAPQEPETPDNVVQFAAEEQEPYDDDPTKPGKF